MGLADRFQGEGALTVPFPSVRLDFRSGELVSRLLKHTLFFRQVEVYHGPRSGPLALAVRTPRIIEAGGTEMPCTLGNRQSSSFPPACRCVARQAAWLR